MQLQFAVLAAPRKFFLRYRKNFPDSNYKNANYTVTPYRISVSLGLVHHCNRTPRIQT